MNRATRALVTVTAILAIAPTAGAQETDGTHRVRRGDTLWELAARYLADPFRWPEIYDLNTRIVEDPHWIFPGEDLQLPGARDGASDRVARSRDRTDAARGRETRPAEGGSQDALRSFGPPGQFPDRSVFRADPRAPSYGSLSIEQTEPGLVVSVSDFYSAAVVADKRSFAPAAVTARVVAEAHPDLRLPRAARLNDQIVLHVSGGTVAVDDYLKAVQWGRSLGDAGHVLYTVGVVRVTRTFPAPDSVRAEVVQIFGDYRVGDAMVMAEGFPVVPGIVPEAESAGPVGTVLAFTDDQTLMATGETLFLDIGAADGLQVGDMFAIFSANEKAAETALFEDRLTAVRVVHTSDATSTARVIEVRDAGMRPGASVRRVERMPQ